LKRNVAAGTQAELVRVRRRVRLTRLIVALTVLAALVVAGRLVRVDYADWATRPGVVLGDSSPAGEAACRYLEALVRWTADPNPETWRTLAAAAVPERRGTPGGDWPWPEPPVSLIDQGLPVGRGPVELESVSWWIPRGRSWPGQVGSRVTACLVQVDYVLTVDPGTAEARRLPGRLMVPMRFDDVEQKWLADPM